MLAQPGHPDTVIVSRGGGAGEGSGIALYVNGVQLPKTGSPNSFALSFNGMRLYTYQNEISSWDFNTFAVGPDGLTLVDDGSMFAYNLGIFGDGNGRVYTTTNQVVDGESHQVLGSLPGAGAFLLPDPGVGRIFSMEGNKIKANDYRSFVPLGVLEIPGAGNAAGSLIRWGADGLAFRTEKQVVILRTPFVGPPVPPADLSVSQLLLAAQGSPGKNLTFTFTVTNRGPAAATGVTLTGKLHPQMNFVSAKSSQGIATFPNNTICVDLGTLAIGATATMTAVFTPTRVGDYTSSAVIRGDLADPNPANNIAMEKISIKEEARPEITASWGPLAETQRNTGRAARMVLQTDLVIRNAGAAPALTSQIKFFLGNQSRLDGHETSLQSISFPTLAAGASQTLKIEIPLPPGVSPGGKFLIALFESGQQPDPGSPKGYSISLGPMPSPPTLLGSWGIVSQLPTAGDAGNRTMIQGAFHLQNTGGSEAPQSTIRFYLASGKTVEKGDLLLQGTLMTPLHPGENKQMNVEVVLPPGVTASGKYLLAVINADQPTSAPGAENVVAAAGPLP